MEPNDSSAIVLGPASRALSAVPGAPLVSAASTAPLREIVASDEQGVTRTLQVPLERPLRLVLDGREIVTLMTLGSAPEWLTLGYLRNQRLMEKVTDIRSVEVDWTNGVARVISRHAAPENRSGVTDQGLVGASPLACGLGTAFGGDVPHRFDAFAPGVAETTSQATIFAILDSMRRHDAIHRAAGSVHSCALFLRGELCVAVEDVSRHNGVDIISGFMSMYGVDDAEKILFTTGRLTGEMVMKAAHNGIPVMISRNGTTSSGYELGVKLGMTLIGRAAVGRYLCYTGVERIARDPAGIS